jgi:NitT/TauT family transport system ATP-binding protein
MNNYRPGAIALKAVKISKAFGDLPVLENFNLLLRQGEFVSLIGPSGCGKTTLLKILAGLIKDFSGELTCQPHDESKLFSSVVFQDFAFFPWLDILDNIKICLNNPMSDPEKNRLALNYLEKVKLSDFKGYLPGELSEGMIQRANFARALASCSQIILMDEPFVHLDFLSRIHLQQLALEILANELRTVFFITHNIHEAITLADRVVVMSSRPGKNVGEFLVDIPRPRDVNKIREEKRYSDLVRAITELLTEEVNKSQQEFDQWIKNRRQAL